LYTFGTFDENEGQRSQVNNVQIHTFILLVALFRCKRHTGLV